MVRQIVPLQPMEVHGGADMHPAAHGGPHARAGARAQRRLWPCGEEPVLEQVFWQHLWPCGRDPTLEQKKSMKEEGAAETAWDELTATPALCPPALLGVRR